MRHHRAFFATALGAVTWYLALEYSIAITWLILLLLALPWVVILGLWIYAGDQHEAGYRIGHAWGLYHSSAATKELARRLARDTLSCPDDRTCDTTKAYQEDECYRCWLDWVRNQLTEQEKENE